MPLSFQRLKERIATQNVFPAIRDSTYVHSTDLTGTNANLEAPGICTKSSLYVLKLGHCFLHRGCSLPSTLHGETR